MQVDLSTRPEKSVGSDEIWEVAENALKEALHSKGWAYELNEGDGAFYGTPLSHGLGFPSLDLTAVSLKVLGH